LTYFPQTISGLPRSDRCLSNLIKEKLATSLLHSSGAGT